MMDEQTLLNFAISVGELMLRNGAETQRVEDTVERILSVKDGQMPEIFATATGIFASIQGPFFGTITKLRRVSDQSINLEKITRANSLSRDFVEGKLTLSEGFDELERIENLPSFAEKYVLLSYGMVCFCFAALFNGSIFDAIAAFFNGIFLGVFSNYLNSKNVTTFLKSLLNGCIVTVFAILFSTLSKNINYEIVILGSIMPLVPGVAITNAVRDIMNRDFLSGTSRVLEATLIAVSVAAGVGIIFSLFNFSGGA